MDDLLSRQETKEKTGQLATGQKDNTDQPPKYKGLFLGDWDHDPTMADVQDGMGDRCLKWIYTYILPLGY